VQKNSPNVPKLSPHVREKELKKTKKKSKSVKKNPQVREKELKNIQINHSAKIAHRVIIAHKVDFSPEWWCVNWH